MDSPGEPLHAAVLLSARDPEGAARELAELLERGFDPDGPDEDGLTPLYAAAVQGSADLVRLLLAAGAAPDRPSGTEGLPLCAAAVWGHLGAVRELLAAGARPDAREEFDLTPLAWAVRGGHVEVVAALLDAGADPELPGAGGEPLLCAAADRGSPAIVRALLGRGAVAGRAEALARARHWSGLDVEVELAARLRAAHVAPGARASVRRALGACGTERVEVWLLGPDGAARSGDSRDAGHAEVVRLLEAVRPGGPA
ncbi:ankyrin repeat domain-containing protein [Streptomyces sp. NPDC127068]|uniref:ankyrin repeat domain-containing protein n=1 Tax=Streptomyces sp. NPDC127068 TaxID=3347127 RepID=UPI00365945C6